MSLSKFESEVKYIPQEVQVVYNRFADLRNLSVLREKLADPAVRERMAAQIPADKLAAAEQQLEQMEFERDTVRLQSPVGEITLCIVEREEPKCLKFEGQGTPIPLYLWIQLLPSGACETKMRVTIGAEVNFFMKSMVSKPLQQAADGLADLLAAAR